MSLQLFVDLFLLLLENGRSFLLDGFLGLTGIDALVECHDVLVYISRGLLLHHDLGLIVRLLLDRSLLFKEWYE